MLEGIVTGDETWVHHYTHPTKEQTMVWKSSDEPAPKRFKAVKSARKSDVHGILGFQGRNS